MTDLQPRLSERVESPDQFTDENGKDWFLKAAFTREAVERCFSNREGIDDPYEITTAWGWIGADAHGEPWLTIVQEGAQGALEFWQVEGGCW